MVAPWKKEEIKRLEDLVRGYKTIGILEFFEMPAAQLHEIRRKLRGKAVIRMSKKNLIEKVLKNTKKEELIKFIRKMPALILTNEDPIKIFREVENYKVPAPAKPGVVAESDIVIPAGPTPLPPMAIGQLKALGLKTKVEGGKITITEDKTVVKRGEVIEKDVAEIINKLGLKPLRVGLKILCLAKDDLLFSREDLKLSIKDYSGEFRDHFKRALLLAISISWINKYTVKPLLQRAYSNVISITKSVLLPVKESLGEHIRRGYKIAKVLNEMVGGG